MDKKFIYVFDKESKNRLLSIGFCMLSENNDRNIFVFKNPGINPVEFYSLPKDKYVLSNTIFF